MGIAYNTSIIRDGLVLYLDAANVKSYPGTGTVWKDLSGNGNNGTLVNGPIYSSNDNGSIVFDGSNDYVSTSFPLNGNSAFTVFCWFKLDTVVKNWQSIIDAFKNATDRNFQLWVNSDSKLYIFHLGSSHSGDSLLSINTWYNAAFSYTGSGNGVLYLNGSVLNESIPKGAGSGGNINVNIGRRVDGNGSSYTNGNISKVQIYNRALSATEIRQNFEALRGRYGI